MYTVCGYMYVGLESSSTLSHHFSPQEPIYVNELMAPAERELFVKLERAEIKIAEVSGCHGDEPSVPACWGGIYRTGGRSSPQRK